MRVREMTAARMSGRPRRAGQGAPRLPGLPALAAGAFAELAQTALVRCLDRRDDDRQIGVTVLVVVVHHGEEVVRGEVGIDAEVGHRGEVGVPQPLVPAVQVAAVLVPDVRLDGAYLVAEFRRVGDGGRRVPGQALVF
jgi:hypothetical protein